MGKKAGRSTGYYLTKMREDQRKKAFWEGAYWGVLPRVVQALSEQKNIINTTEPTTGMAALHMAVCRDHFDIVVFLVQSGAKFFPDKKGRWPSTLAAGSAVSEMTSDYILKAEAAAIQAD